MASRLTARGPRANAPARMPALQTALISDPVVRQALEALREAFEVRLGSRGDVNERAVTRREYDPQIAEFERRIRELEKKTKDLEEALDKLQRTDVSGETTFDGITVALRAINADLAALKAKLPAAMAPTFSGTGYAKLSSGKISALSLALTRAELAGDGLTVDALGFRGWPVNSQSANYTTVAGDADGLLLHPAADDVSRVFTVAANADVPYQVGSMLAVANETAATLVVSSTDSLVLAGTNSATAIGLPRNTLALFIKVAATKWLVCGWSLNAAAPGLSAGSATVVGVGLTVLGDARRLQRLVILHEEGTEGSTTHTNTAPNGYSCTTGGGAIITTSASKFGSSCLRLDGAAYHLLFNFTGSDWDLSGQWEVEMHYKPESTPVHGAGSTSIQMLYCRRVDDSNRTFLGYSDFSSLQSVPGIWFRIDNGGSFDFIHDVTLSTSVFTHIKLTYDGTTYRLFLDGTLVKSQADSHKHVPSSGTILYIGYGWSSSFYAKGWLDEYILTNGGPVSTATFTAPTAALADFLAYGAAGSAAGTSTAAGVAGHVGLARGVSQAQAYST